MAVSAALSGSVPWNVVRFSAPPAMPGEPFTACIVIGMRLLGRRDPVAPCMSATKAQLARAVGR